VAGSLTGYAGKKIMGFTGIEAAGIYIPIYVVVVTLIWPLMVIVISVPMGQFVFFRGYLKKMGRRIRGKRKDQMNKEQMNKEQGEMINGQRSMFNVQTGTGNQKRLAIFASGTGSNTQQIIDYFTSPSVKWHVTVSLIVCNKPGAGVLQIAQTKKINTLLIDRERFFYGDAYLDVLHETKIELIVLAGFLWKIPLPIIHAFPKRIINIHPALLPKYGGKGMYGNKVHEAVIEAGEKKSGITIHYVDEHYDEGDIIFQATCDVLPGDTPETLAQRIHKLEHKHYPAVIERLIRNSPGKKFHS
jgi:formyltetrahydrofolate-dependent phosphoribosylglycinamide formyltransferase